jgi:hypothetical protein
MAKDLLTDPFAAPAEPTPDLIKNGRYWLPPISDPTAKRIGWTRATTLVKTVSDMFLIDRYHQREIMIGLAKREDLYDRVCATDFDDKDALNAPAVRWARPFMPPRSGSTGATRTACGRSGTPR